MSLPQLNHGAYTIGWVCALPKEMTAAIAILDTIHDGLPQPASDYNNYCLGSIREFNIVIAGLPSGDIGSQPASAVAIRMQATFPNVNMGLVVGIGGGVPTKEKDIRLGDVVVSIPANGFGGVVQHDMGKNTKDGGWVRTGSLNGPPSLLKTTISKLMALHQMGENKIEFHLAEMIERHPHLSPLFTRQESFKDVLFEPEPENPEEFEGWVQVERPPRKSHEMIKIHYGLISSGNQVIKSGRHRDSLSARLGGVLCFEMEAAGLMNELPCIVIRGICDYADAHKNKEWQEYAAAVAAAYAKELVLTLPTHIVDRNLFQDTRTISQDVPNQLSVSQNEASGNAGPYWVVPFSRNKNFVGREREISTLEQWSSSEDVCNNMAVFGLGGVGKTQIALEFAYRTREQKPTCSVFWVPATDPTAFEQAYKQIGQALSVPGIESKGADVKQLVKDALSDENGIGAWLMVVDNADDINMVFRKPNTGDLAVPALIDYIPSTPNSRTMLTTRNRKVAVRQAANKTIFLEEMGEKDSKRLLEKSLIQQEVLSDKDDAEALLRLLGFLPLAIIQAAAYINENDTTIGEYMSLCNDSEPELMEVLSEDFEVHGRYKTIKSAIATTWLVSLSQLSRTHPAAIDHLSFMACMSNHGISQSLLPPAPSKKQGLEAVGALKAYSFIRKREDGPSFDIHPLVHLATRNWLRSEGKLQIWTSNAVLRLVDLLPEGGHENQSTWTAYLPHAEYLLTSAVTLDGNLKVVVLAEKLSQCLYSTGQYSKAYSASERALDLRIKASGTENRYTLKNMSRMAGTLIHQGKYKEAEYQHRRVLEIRKRVLGPKDPEVGKSMNYLAQALYGGGFFVESEQWHRRALELQTEVLGPEHTDSLTSTGHVATTLGQQGRYKEAEEMQRTLLQTCLRVQDEESPDTLATMAYLGVAQGNVGDHCAAEKTHRRVLALWTRMLGDRHPKTSNTKRRLADTLMRQGRYDEAFEVNRQALEAHREMLGVKNPDTILTLGNLGDICAASQQTERAEGIYRHVVELLGEVYGAEHPLTLWNMNSLARVLRAQGKDTEAKSLYEKVLDARVRVLGPQHPKTLETLAEL